MYVTLCRPLFLNMLVKCGTPFWLKHISIIDKIEMVQRKAVRFISNLRGREGFTSEREALDLELLQDRRMDARVKLSSDTHSLLTDDFNNITTQQTALHSHVTRSVTSSKPLAITATKQQVYFNSFFLPKTSTTRDLKEL